MSTATVVRGADVDADGYPVGDDTRTGITAFELTPRGASTESGGLTRQVISGLTLFGYPDETGALPDIRPGDRVEVGDAGPYTGDWDVVGEPGVWLARTAVGRSAVEVVLERVTG